MKKILRFIFLPFCLLLAYTPMAQQPNVKRVVFQGFWWDYWNTNFPNKWANYLAELAPRLKAAGFDAVWIPPVYKNSSTNDVGYGPFDLYDLGDKYQKGGDSIKNTTRIGTKDELLRMIAVMHANGIEVIQDIVMNHNNGAGNLSGVGGQDPETTYSMVTNNGYKNFRFSSYVTPLIDDSQDDYFTRNGRWPKNFTNFHPNAGDNCTTGDICAAYFGPDISYEAASIGQSTNIPTAGSATIGSITRPYINPTQPADYMRNSGRDWITWFKKQTGSDGMRWDAVKHFPIAVQEDYIYNVKYGVPDFAKGGQDMFCVGEWIGSATDLDAYVNNVKTGVAPGGVTDEKHTGTFDFSMRGYGTNGGIYNMVKSLGGYDMQNLPGDQQGERYMQYPDGHRVHRTVPFVNSHDSYRPRLDNTGNFLNALGVDSGWHTSDELGGNGQHIDPREPRLAAAYAAISAVDGNPDFFIEDVFDIGTTGKRYSHLPADTADLPIRKDLVNIIQAHQKLGFKNGDYAVPTSLTGTDAPYYQKGNSTDHLVIERAGKAIIGITDYYNTAGDNSADEEAYVTVNAALAGQRLYDYSGAHDTSSSLVYADSRVLIKTAPVGHTIPGAHGHGYSIWAPAPAGGVSSVNDLYNYIAAYVPLRSHATTQEWEMANDLGDSHCKSAGQGGRLPDSSTKQRVVGKIFSQENDTISYKVYPETDGRNITISLWDLNGNKLYETTGIANSSSPVAGTYTPISPGWIIIKVRNTVNNQPGQKCYVNVTYTAPAVVNTHSGNTDPATHVSVWSGNKGTSDVFDCGNWEEGRIPDIFTKAIIPAYAEIFPVIRSDFAVGGLTVETGASFTVDSATLSIGGAISALNNVNAIKGTIEMKGQAIGQNLPGNAFVNNTVQNLIINNPLNVDLSSNLYVTKVLTPQSGSLASVGYLILKSDSTSTARIAKGSPAGGYITGNVNVERYIAPRNAYRLITAPFISSQAIHAGWQENATSATDNPAPGYGTYITGGAAANGFDQSPANDTSMFYYDWAAQMFVPVPATTASLSAYYGYLMQVRGNRGTDITIANPPATATVLRGKGVLKTGDQSPLSILANKLFLVGNPYASPVDFTQIQKQNLADRYFVLDPKRGAHGAFVLLEGPAYTPANAIGHYTGRSTIIQSSQAFMIEGGASGVGTFSFTEACKSDTENTTFQTVIINDQRLQVNLRYINPDLTTTIADDATARFDDTYTAAVTDEDAGKPVNKGENLGITRQGNKLMTVEKRPLVTLTDTIFLWISNMQQSNYQLEFMPVNIPDTISVFLEDTYLNISTPVDVTMSSIAPFSITADAASAAAGRFRIVFKNNSILPLNFMGIKAYQKDKNIQVEWNVATEANTSSYEVQKSATGTAFEKMMKVAAKVNNNNAAAYTWLDVHPLPRDNYYRIKSVDKTNAVKYSQVVKVKTGAGKAEIFVYPNPVKNKSVTVQLNNQPQGRYVIELFTANGQKIYTYTMQHAGGSAARACHLDSALPKGIYHLKITGQTVQKVVKVAID